MSAGTRREVFKSIELNLLPITRVKETELFFLLSEYLVAANEILVTLKSERPMSQTKLHHLTYAKIRQKSKLPSQLVCAARSDAWAKRNNKITSFKRLPASFNVPRSASLKQTWRGNPILILTSLNRRIGLPIAMDGAWYRFQTLLSKEWTFTELRLINTHLVRLTVRREFEVASLCPYQGVLGVDVGVRTFAAITILDNGRNKQQLYLGRNIWQVKRDLGLRRSRLQSYASQGSRRARRVLRNLRGYERRFDKTNCFQVAHTIVSFAKQSGATIAMEDLAQLCDRKLSRRSDRKVKRMPYFILRQAVELVAWQENVKVTFVNPRYTSQTCSRCGARGARRGKVFTCKNCGFTANSDRNASVNIAKLLWERTRHDAKPLEKCPIQFSQSGAEVNQPVRCHDCSQALARSYSCRHEHKPPVSTRGG